LGRHLIAQLDRQFLRAYDLRLEGIVNGSQLRDVFEKIVPANVVEQHVFELGIQERERKLEVMSLVIAMVMSGGNHRFGTQSVMLQRYLDLGVPKVSRAAFYGWFTEGLAELMLRLSTAACAWVASRPCHLPGLLAGRTDWRVVDASTVKVPIALQPVYPGDGDYAALKLHVEYSLGVENIVGYTISPAREHEARHLVVDEARRGQGLLVDLGYASHALLDRCAEFDVKYVIRVKSGWEFWFDGRASEEERQAWLDEGGLGERFGAEDLRAGADVVDVDVTVGHAGSLRKARLVAFTTPKGRVMFLTNLPRTTHSHAEVGLVYRLRWTVELANKICKSAMSVEEIFARTDSSARTLIHSAMLASVLAHSIAHEEHILRGWVGEKRRAISESPIHPIAVALKITRNCQGLADALANPDTAAAFWDRQVAILIGLSADPNWRRKPSALDVVKGRTHKLLPVKLYAADPVAALERLK
jgi:hypothetical protein